jgi:hypothetical protein
MAALVLTIGLVASATPMALAQDAPSIDYVDLDGINHGTVTITEIADPFLDSDPNQPPRDGERYVGIKASFEAAADQTFDARPTFMVVEDTMGNLYWPGYIPRAVDPMLPDLQAQTLAPGNKISGLIPYNVRADAVIDRVLWMPTADRLLTITDVVPEPGPAAGTDFLYQDPTGPAATITISVADPFIEHDPGYPPAEGTRFVVLHAIFQNSGSLPFRVDPYALVLLDASGVLHTSDNVYVPPGYPDAFLEPQNTSPGDRVSGLVAYVLPIDMPITEVQYRQTATRQQTVVDLVSGTDQQPIQPTPAPATPAPSVVPVEPTPVASVTPDPSAGTGR